MQQVQKFPPVLICLTTPKSSSMEKGQHWSSFGHCPYSVSLQINLHRVHSCSGFQASNPTRLSQPQKNSSNNENGQKCRWDSAPNILWVRGRTAFLCTALLATPIFSKSLSTVSPDSCNLSVQSPRTSARRKSFWELGESGCCSFRSLQQLFLSLPWETYCTGVLGTTKEESCSWVGTCQLSSPALAVWCWRSNFRLNDCGNCGIKTKSWLQWTKWPRSASFSPEGYWVSTSSDALNLGLQISSAAAIWERKN